MPYITSIERLAKQEGWAEGLAEGRAEMLILALACRFQTAVPEALATRIRAATEAAMLEQWPALVFVARTLEEFQQKIQS